MGAAMVVSEGDGYVDVPVTLSAPAPSNVSVRLLTVQGTAHQFGQPDPDYVATDVTMTFAPGETTKTVRIDLVDDVDPEVVQSFTAQLGNNSANSTIAPPLTINIVDNDNGTDVLSFGPGDDTYTVTDPTDVIVENPGGGTDTVFSSVTFTLPPNVENLTLTGTDPINGTGNTLKNKLKGNSAANVLDGLGGADTLTGGAGADTFVFGSLSGFDTVTDFSSVDDTFLIKQAGIHIGNGDAVVNGGLTRTSAGGFKRTAELVIFKSNIAGAINTTSAAAKIGSATKRVHQGQRPALRGGQRHADRDLPVPGRGQGRTREPVGAHARRPGQARGRHDRHHAGGLHVRSLTPSDPDPA